MKKILSEKASYLMIFIGLSITLLTVLSFLWKASLFQFDKPIQADKVGQFGDFIGGVVGTIFSLTGVILFYVALREQRKDFNRNAKILELQKEELQLQRQELQETRKVFEEQSHLMQDQKNDSRFFGLLQNHKEVVASFMKGEEKFNGNYSNLNRKTTPVSGYEVLDRIAEKWRLYFKEYKKAFETKTILRSDLSDHNGCIDIIKKDSIASLHFKELHNLYLFIQEKLKNDSFYFNTLNVNLTDNERFIFETMYYNFEEERKELQYKNKTFFNPELNIDFRNDILPVVKVNTSYIGRSYNWISITSNVKVKEIKFIVCKEDDDYNYNVEDVVSIPVRNVTTNSITKLHITSVFIEDVFIMSNIDIHEFPFGDMRSIRGKKFVFDITLEKNELDFHFWFKYSVTEDEVSRSILLPFYQLRNHKVNDLGTSAYNSIIKALKQFNITEKAEKPKYTKEAKINFIIYNFFTNNRVKRIIAKELSEEFISKGVFLENEGSIAIVKFLNQLREKGEINKIPFAYYDDEWEVREWYFVSKDEFKKEF